MIRMAMSLRSVLMLAVLSFLQQAAVAHALPLIDQAQPLIVPDFFYAITSDPNSEQKLAQVITTGISGFLVELDLPVGISSGDLRVEIQGVVGGVPDGTVLTSQVYPAPLPIPAPPEFIRLSFSSPVSFNVGDPFAIVLTSTGSAGLAPGPLGDPYAGGDAFFDARPNPPGWLPLSAGLPPPLFRSDLPFQTFVEPVATPEASTLLFLTVGLAALGVRLRRRLR